MAAARNSYWLIGFGGIALTALLSVLICLSLEDWDFYYKMDAGIGLDFVDGPLLTRIVSGNKWIIFLPAVLLLCGLTFSKRRSPLVAALASTAATSVVMLLGYLTAYLPVAMPEWWGDKRPTHMIKHHNKTETNNPKQGGGAKR